MGTTTATNGVAIAALVAGILSLVCLGPIAGVVAVILGFIGIKKADDAGNGRGTSMVGIVLGVVGSIAWIAIAVLVVFAADEAGEELDDLTGVADAADYELVEESCEVDDVGIVTFSGTIENTSTTEKGFTVHTEIADADTGRVLDSGSVTKDDIQPGAVERWGVITTGVDEDADLECRVTSVNNFFN